jgi:hypothetical protein
MTEETKCRNKISWPAICKVLSRELRLVLILKLSLDAQIQALICLEFLARSCLRGRRVLFVEARFEWFPGEDGRILLKCLTFYTVGLSLICAGSLFFLVRI